MGEIVIKMKQCILLALMVHVVKLDLIMQLVLEDIVIKKVLNMQSAIVNFSFNLPLSFQKGSHRGKVLAMYPTCLNGAM